MSRLFAAFNIPSYNRINATGDAPLFGILLTTAMAVATAGQSSPTLETWAAQDAQSRRLALVGAVEGVLLATSAVNGLSVPVNTDCFNTQTPEFLESALLAKARAFPAQSLAQGLITIDQCARRGAGE
ncbi:hypothetical protein [Sphingomonas sp. 3-13AW]|uniref:hypothetical protein n=1 Tax=Sphingomonas sp. 3-13AW TaxID=3050450 RepID=UPI003BB5050D